MILDALLLPILYVIICLFVECILVEFILKIFLRFGLETSSLRSLANNILDDMIRLNWVKTTKVLLLFDNK